MPCSRCQGFMVWERIYPRDVSGRAWYKCVNCGDRLDQTIKDNRYIKQQLDRIDTNNEELFARMIRLVALSK